MKDLTGIWTETGGGTHDLGHYYLRQVGQKFFGTGEPVTGTPFKNVFSGTINGTTIETRWADLAGGDNRGSGVITLTIKDEGDTLEYVSQKSGSGFGGRLWKRQ